MVLARMSGTLTVLGNHHLSNLLGDSLPLSLPPYLLRRGAEHSQHFEPARRDYYWLGAASFHPSLLRTPVNPLPPFSDSPVRETRVSSRLSHCRRRAAGHGPKQTQPVLKDHFKQLVQVLPLSSFT